MSAIKITHALATQRRVLSGSEVAQRLGVALATVEKWRQQGIGPVFMKLSARVVYPIELLEEFERDSLRKSTSEKA
jgi:predicted site-specific integrase-resolvase